MKNSKHNFKTPTIQELIHLDNDDRLFSDNFIKNYVLCKRCNLLACLYENKYFYYGHGVGDDNIIDITCDEYIIKKLLE